MEEYEKIAEQLEFSFHELGENTEGKLGWERKTSWGMGFGVGGKL